MSQRPGTIIDVVIVWGCLAFVIFTCWGCDNAPPIPTATPARAAAAIEVHYAIALNDQDAVPTPPEPLRLGKCINCNGTGKLGDTRVTFDCKVCGGDGTVDQADLDRHSDSQAALEAEVQPDGGDAAVSQVVADDAAEEDSAAAKPAAPQADVEGPHVAWVSAADARRLARTSSRPVLIHFETAGCAPCEAWKKQVAADPRAVQLINSRTIPVRVFVPAAQRDTGVGAIAKFAIDCGVRQYPCEVLVTNHWTRISPAAGPELEPAKYLKQLSDRLPPLTDKEDAMIEDEQGIEEEPQASDTSDTSDTSDAGDASDTVGEQQATAGDTVEAAAEPPATIEQLEDPPRAELAEDGKNPVFDTIRTGMIEAGLIRARKLMVTHGAGIAIVAGHDTGVRVELQNDSTSLQINLPGDDGRPKLRLPDERNGKPAFVEIDLIELAENLRTTLAKCRETNG